jgi:hypothetical protein
MVSADVISEVRRLLAGGALSQRAISRQLGIPRGTVGAVAAGRRPDLLPRRGDELDEFAPRGPYVRCPTCGGKVQMPCVACRARGWK